MRFNSSPARMLMRASCVLVFWLLSPSLAQAATTQGRSSGELCDAHSTTLRKLIRHSKSYGGPLARRPHRALFGLSDVTARMQRGASANLNDDDAAIQNDAPAANIDADDGAGPTLRPLGLLIGSVDSQPRSQAFTPQSPRAPPFAA